MKKFVYALAACLALCLTAGCEDDDPGPDPVPEGENVTLTEAGTLRTVLGDRLMDIEAIVIDGQMDYADLSTLCYASLNGELESIDLSGARLEDNVIPEYTFCWFINGAPASDGARPANAMENIPGQTPKFTRFVFPANLEEIKTYAFAFTLIESLEFPAALREIGAGAFCDCDHLKQDRLFFPEGLEKIGMTAFRKASLRDVVFPMSLKEIGAEAFDGAIAGAVYSLSPEPPVCLGESVFSGCDNSTLHVPVGAKDAYSKANGWREFGKIVETDKFPALK